MRGVGQLPRAEGPARVASAPSALAQGCPRVRRLARTRRPAQCVGAGCAGASKPERAPRCCLRPAPGVRVLGAEASRHHLALWRVRGPPPEDANAGLRAHAGFEGRPLGHTCRCSVLPSGPGPGRRPPPRRYKMLADALGCDPRPGRTAPGSAPAQPARAPHGRAVVKATVRHSHY